MSLGRVLKLRTERGKWNAKVAFIFSRIATAQIHLPEEWEKVTVGSRVSPEWHLN